MKRFTKVSLIIAAILGCVGLSLCITALVLGVTLEEVSKTQITWNHHAKKVVVNEGDLRDFEEAFDRVESLEVEVEAGNVLVEESDTDQVVVIGKGVAPSFQCAMEGRTLKIEDKNHSYVKLDHFRADDGECKITVQVPRGTVFQNMELNIKAGSLEVLGFQTKKLEAECEAGSAQLEGDIRGECELTCGVGKLTYRGNLGGNTSVECGMGSVEMELANTQEEFDYALECGMGQINVGDLSIKGIAGEKEVSNQANRKMEIECGMGEVNATFGN